MRHAKQAPVFSTARRDLAIWLTILEAREYLRLGDRAEYERLLALAANFQLDQPKAVTGP